MIRANKFERITPIIKTYSSITLIIAGILVLLFDVIYNILQGSFSFISKEDNIVIMFGFLCIFFGSALKIRFELKNIQKDMEEKARHEEMEEKKREMEFAEMYPGISRVWGVRGIVKWMHKEGWWYSAGLIIILILFAFIRIPYMDNSFAGVPNSDKYATYLPNLINMYNSGNPFLNQNFAYTSILDNNQTSSSGFGTIPFFGWAFLLFMPLTELISLEILIRSLLTALGMFLLFLIYLFFKKVIDKKMALFGILLLAINPVFQLITYITVMDLPALLFMFIALNLYLNKNKNLSYVFCGLSILAKDSFLLITFPALALLILFEEKKDIYNLIKLIFFSMLPMFLSLILINPIPSKTFVEGIFRVLLMVFFIYIFYTVIKNNDLNIKEWINSFNRKFRYFPIFLLVFIFILVGLVYKDRIIDLSSEFLTDEDLIFNWAMYFKILIDILIQVPSFLFLVFPFGLLLSILNKRGRKISLAILFSGGIYLIVASKVIFFHYYYKHIFVFILVLYFLYIISFMNKTRINNAIKIFLIFMVVIILIIPSYKSSIDLLDLNIEGTHEMSEYLENNFNKSYIILANQDITKIFTIYNNVKIDRGSYKKSIILRDGIKNKGFVETFHQYNARYYLSQGEGDFKEFTHLFMEELDIDRSSRRKDLILDRLGQRNYYSYYSTDFDQSFEEYRPDQYFKLEKMIGDWYLYKIE